MIEQMTGGALIREQCFVGGRWVAARSGETLRVHDPADRRVVAAVPSMSSEDVRAAVDAAVEAFDAWRDTLPGVRATLLRRWLDLIKAHRSELAAILTAESGKPLNEALGEIDYAASYVEWFAEEARRAYGDVVPSHQPDKRVLVIRQPVGPVAAITSWNFPSALVTRKAAPALAAGCTVIIKPASQTPLSSLALAELGQRAGFPPGVLNVVTGPSATVGPALLADPRIRKLTFTGSTDTGKALMRACADTLKRVSLELGGNAPFIVFDDADLERAVDGAMQSKFRNAGQTCVCTNRLLVHESLYEPFVAQLADRVARLKVGAGADPGTEIGPLIDESAVCKMESHVADAISRGARVVVGGCRLAPSGTFFAPTVLADVTSDMRVAREETFGPLAPVFRFRSETEAVSLANATEFGLAAYFYSRDVGRVFRVAERIEAGMVGVNTGLISTATAPFGGVKESGMGREGSRHGLDDYTSLKYMCLGGI